MSTCTRQWGDGTLTCTRTEGHEGPCALPIPSIALGRKFTYEVEARERGDWTEPGGRWEVAYKGSDRNEAFDEAEAAATNGKVVRISVQVRR